MTDPRRRIGPRSLVPAVVLGAGVIVLVTALEGRARVAPIVQSTPAPIRMSPVPQLSASAPPPPADGFGLAVNAVVGTILLVLAGIVGIVLLLVLVRLLVALVRSRPHRVDPEPIDSSGLAAGLQVADAPTVRRGIAAALAAFDEDREPTDAIVQAWLGLQQTAEDAGFARAPSETPTEFTGRVLTRSTADRDALGTLLRLYLRARFDSAAVTADDAAGALAALRALEVSWGDATVAGRA